MIDKTKIIKKDISYMIRTCKKVAKALAKQHNTREFINRINPMQSTISSLFSDLFLEDAPEYNRISYKKSQFENDIDFYWEYCKGDTRIKLN